MKLYPALLTISAGICLTMPALRLVRHWQEYNHFEYLTDDRFFVGTAVAGLFWTPILAFLVWLPAKAIVTIWKRAATRGNRVRNASESVTSPDVNAPDASRG